MAVIDVNKAFGEAERRNNVGSEGYQKIREDMIELFRAIKGALQEREVAYDFSVMVKAEDFGTVGKGLRQHVTECRVELTEDDKKLTGFVVDLQGDVSWKDNKADGVKVLLRFRSFDEMSRNLFESEIHDRTQEAGYNTQKWRKKSDAEGDSFEFLLHSGHVKNQRPQELPANMQERIVDLVYALCETLDASEEHGPKPPEQISDAEFNQPVAKLENN